MDDTKSSGPQINPADPALSSSPRLAVTHNVGNPNTLTQDSPPKCTCPADCEDKNDGQSFQWINPQVPPNSYLDDLDNNPLKDWQWIQQIEDAEEDIEHQYTEEYGGLPKNPAIFHQAIIDLENRL